jgi:hypothetical protein
MIALTRVRALGLLLLTVMACEVVDTVVVEVARVDIQPPQVTVLEGESSTVTAIPRSAAGHTLYDRPVQWAVSPSGIARVTGDGMVTGVSQGTGTLRATVEGVSGDAQLTVLPAPSLALSRDEVAFTAEEGEVTPSGSVAISNAGAGTITGLSARVVYTGVQPDGWLAAGLNGTTAPTELILQASAEGLSRGQYQASVIVESPVAGGLSATVSVAFTVVAPDPRIVLETRDLFLVAIQGSEQPAVQVVDITNGGDGNLTGLTALVSYPQGAAGGWLGAALSSTEAPAELTLSASPQGLDVGSYSATVRVSSPVASNSPQDISVTFNVNPQTVSSEGVAEGAGENRVSASGPGEGS